MNNNYKDILDRIKEPPKWWDKNGTPRYGEFHPDLCPDLYASEIALLRIACQGCGYLFDVEVHKSYADKGKLSDAPQDIFYGDPPNVGCCAAGPTMSSISLHVIQFWQRENYRWVRRPAYENTPIESLGDYFEEQQIYESI